MRATDDWLSIFLFHRANLYFLHDDGQGDIGMESDIANKSLLSRLKWHGL